MRTSLNLACLASFSVGTVSVMTLYLFTQGNVSGGLSGLAATALICWRAAHHRGRVCRVLARLERAEVRT